MKNHMNKTFAALAVAMLAGLAAPMATADPQAGEVLCTSVAAHPADDLPSLGAAHDFTFVAGDVEPKAIRFTPSATDDDLYFWTGSGAGNAVATIYKARSETVLSETVWYCSIQDPAKDVGILSDNDGTDSTPERGSLTASQEYRIVVERKDSNPAQNSLTFSLKVD